MRELRFRLLAVLIGLSVLPATLFAATAGLSHTAPVEFHVLAPSTLQDLEPAIVDISAEKSEIDAASVSAGTQLSLASFSDAIAKPPYPSNESDDFVHDGPRSRMKKWFLGILLIGALVRYLSSDSYRRFVSEVLDPLNW